MKSRRGKTMMLCGEDTAACAGPAPAITATPLTARRPAKARALLARSVPLPARGSVSVGGSPPSFDHHLLTRCVVVASARCCMGVPSIDLEACEAAEVGHRGGDRPIAPRRNREGHVHVACGRGCGHRLTPAWEDC